MPHIEYQGPDGKPWPSVTEICDILAKPGLYRFYAENGWEGAEAIKIASGKIGTEFHNEVFHQLTGTHNPDPLSPQAKAMVQTFLSEFVIPYQVKPIQLERHVINSDRRYHGSFDGIVHVTNMPIEVRYGKPSERLFTGNVLADWKSSNGIYDSHGIQLGGYYKAMPFTDVGLIVQVHRDTLKLKYKFFEGLDHYGDVFYNAREIWDYTHNKGAWERPLKGE